MYLCGQRSPLKAMNLAAFYGSCSLWPDLWLISGQITPGDPGHWSPSSPGVTDHRPVTGEWPRPGLSPLVTTEE